jgi:hypothetical protein
VPAGAAKNVLIFFHFFANLTTSFLLGKVADERP